MTKAIPIIKEGQLQKADFEKTKIVQPDQIDKSDQQPKKKKKEKANYFACYTHGHPEFNDRSYRSYTKITACR
ncbi:MAG: hypothetical protein LRY71_13400 [Bacillaceae bacterium]|nr:hypothetical protein [Bacillaceae bacterium]